MLAVGSASGAQVPHLVQAQDGAVIRVSAAEPNLVEAESGRITAFVFTQGKFIETIDEAAGVVYFRPLAEGPRSGFVEVTDAAGNRSRFALVLIPEPTWPAQRIVLQDSEVRRSEGSELGMVPALPAADHVAAIKALMRTMLTAGTGSALQPVAPTQLEIGPWVLTRLASMRQGGLLGEMLRLENQGGVAMVIDEARYVRKC